VSPEGAQATELQELLAAMAPELIPGEFVFVERPTDLPDEFILAGVQEQEGQSAVIRREDADERSLEYEFVAAWITLRVNSALHAVGLTAAVSTRLAENRISCNVIAGLRHDHLLVPSEEGPRALRALKELSATSADD
jgi:hypothetical protein